MQQDKTYYEVLDLPEDASAEELKQAYRSLIKIWHPDLYPGMPVSDCRKTFFAFSVRADKHILSRFNLLSDEEKKEYADIIELLKECINFREKK